ncbi:MAG TPA: hypothetical protein VE988_19590 [Gemmataceae bacterium]|nr:hypothetical protein [Gemmataceae bacterium]
MATIRTLRSSKLLLLVALAWGLAAGSQASAQTGGGYFPIRDSSVGYIDSAIPGNMLRFRFDAAYENHHPSRAEFFWAPGSGKGPGLPLTETSVDYQEARGYLELLMGESWSLFFEVPTRFINPDINENHAGLGDVDGGIKWAVLQGEAGTLSLQFRTYAPTGNPHLGLSNAHTTLEPGVLFFLPVSETAALEGECRYFVPLGGDAISGDVIRYGLGLQCKMYESKCCRLTPVLETVGWTFLHGGDPVVTPDGTFIGLANATGETIVNIKVGMRVGAGEHMDFYGGWSRPLTGDKFYEHEWRLEMRLLF